MRTIGEKQNPFLFEFKVIKPVMEDSVYIGGLYRKDAETKYLIGFNGGQQVDWINDRKYIVKDSSSITVDYSVLKLDRLKNKIDTAILSKKFTLK